MNYKKHLLLFVSEGKKNLLEVYKNEGYSVEALEALEKAYDLFYTILENRFENELKQYNHVKEKAYDEYVANKNLNYLRIYIEELLLLDKNQTDIGFYKEVQKHMRYLLNGCYDAVLYMHIYTKGGEGDYY